ncbi:unnamed protein product [Ranitomeya imitator]|uniref:Uncharacterized protein n=1 Tax=Ranitomeya imitator TaxID=111125 RepID=A0ABN9M1H0_9NEOB|nr:unnamed protein product [Ranitomeya imitator]
MGQALTPAHFLANIVNIQYQGQNLSAEEEELAMTWVSSNHPSLMPTIINFRAKGEPFKKYMFAEDILRKVTPVNWWKSLKRLDLETAQDYVIVKNSGDNVVYKSSSQSPKMDHEKDLEKKTNRVVDLTSKVLQLLTIESNNDMKNEMDEEEAQKQGEEKIKIDDHQSGSERSSSDILEVQPIFEPVPIKEDRPDADFTQENSINFCRDSSTQTILAAVKLDLSLKFTYMFPLTKQNIYLFARRKAHHLGTLDSSLVTFVNPWYIQWYVAVMMRM